MITVVAVIASETEMLGHSSGCRENAWFPGCLDLGALARARRVRPCPCLCLLHLWLLKLHLRPSWGAASLTIHSGWFPASTSCPDTSVLLSDPRTSPYLAALPSFPGREQVCGFARQGWLIWEEREEGRESTAWTKVWGAGVRGKARSRLE